MTQQVWYEDIISKLNTNISIPYVFEKDLAQHNISGIPHKIQYDTVIFEVLLGNPIYMTDGTQIGTIIIYPIYELEKKHGENRKIGVYEIVPEDLPKVYEDVRDNNPNINMLGRPYFYNFILGENNLQMNRINPVIREQELKYGRGFDWNKKQKIKIGNYDINAFLNEEERLKARENDTLEKDNDLRDQAQEAQKKHNIQEQKKKDLLAADKLRQQDKLDTRRRAKTHRKMETHRGSEKPEMSGMASIMDTFNKRVLNKTKKNKYIFDESHNWLQKYMKNINYEIIEHEDVTMFGALSQLLDESSEDIREKLSNFVTADDFVKQRTMHMKLTENIKKLHNAGKPSEKDLQKLNNAIIDYEYLFNINTFDKFKDAIKVVKGNLLLLTVVERMYDNKYKVVVLKNNNRNNRERETKFEKIVLCNNTTIDPLTKNASKNMQYGMLSFDNGKYNSIKYDNKGLLLYNDVPSAIQKRLIDNCINV